LQSANNGLPSHMNDLADANKYLQLDDVLIACSFDQSVHDNNCAVWMPDSLDGDPINVVGIPTLITNAAHPRKAFSESV